MLRPLEHLNTYISGIRKWFIWTLFYLLHFTGSATNPDHLLNTYSLHNWNTEDRLPQSSVNTIMQSSDGYLWIGTFGGIARFDGLTFEHIKHPKLMYERVISLFEDQNGYIWIGSENNGLYRYKNGQVKHYNLENGFPGVGITSIFQYGDKVGVLIQGKGIAAISGDKIEFHQSKVLDGELLEQAIVDERGDIWIVSSKGVFLQKGILAEPQYVENSFHEEDGFAIAIGKDKQIYFGNQDGFFRINRAALKAEYLFDHQIGFLSQQFCISNTGVFWYGGKGNELHCKSDEWALKWGKSDGVPNGEISCVYEDQSGNIWVGLNGGGLIEFYRNQVNVLASETELAQKIFLAIHPDQNGKLWMATNNGGFYSLDTVTQTIQRYNEQNNITADIWSLASSPKGGLWGGTFGNGIFYANTNETDVFTRIDEWGGGSKVILAMIYDTLYDRLLIGSDQGGVFQYRNQKWSNIIPDHIDQDRVTKFTPSPNGDMYVSTQGNGIHVIRDTEVSSLDKSNGLPSNTIRDIFFDSEGIMWLGSYSSGIIVNLNGQFVTIDQNAGLFDNLISTIREDQLGYLWMSCNSGVFRAKRKDLLQVARGELDKVQCQVFNKSHGMGHSETNGGFQSSSIQFEDGTLLYPTMKGISVFKPENLQGYDTLSNVVIRSISYGDTSYETTNEIRIPAEYRDVEFAFTAPTFFAPELITFEYYLEGYEREWSSVGRNRLAVYKKLKPGTYVFKVRARNSQGILSRSYAEQEITIAPYFYETTAFRWVVSGFILIVIFGTYAWQNIRAEKREIMLKRIVSERTVDLENEKKLTEEALQKVEEQSQEIQKMSTAKADFFQSISHELKTPLTLIKGPVEALLDSDEVNLESEVREDLGLVKKQANYLTDLISQLLDIARSEDGYLKKQEEPTDIIELTQKVISSVDSWIQQKEINFESYVRLQRVKGLTDIDFVEKIIKNLLTNAIKFTPPNGVIDLSLGEIGDDLLITVSDSGKGIGQDDLPYIFDRYYTKGSPENENTAGTGIGLALVKEFIHLLGGEIKVEKSDLYGGAEFVCRIPFFRLDDLEVPTEIPKELTLSQTAITANGELDETELDDQKKVILVVDDHSDIRTFIKRSLNKNYRIEEAENGEEGLVKALNINPDVIISDINMPKKDGLEMLSELKLNSKTDYIPVLLLTARGSEKIKVKGWDEGADGYMAKPFNANELSARVNGIIENRKKLRRRIEQELSTSDFESDGKSDFEKQFENLVHSKLTHPEYSFNESLGDFAMSLSKFQRTVKEHYGMTPQVYLRLQRLDMAKNLIEKNRGSISEIAYACGFNSVSYFNRVFKKTYQITPSDLI